jgi:diacylglycerol O-acyltransferase
MNTETSQLSALDAAFLFAESPECPMHVATLAIVRPSEEAADSFYDDVRALFAARVLLVPSLLRKLVNAPYEIDRPSWISDDHFDADYHVKHVVASEPRDRAWLERTVAFLHSQRLDRSRPLWQVHVFTGLSDGETAIYMKMHHALVDGGAGVALAQILYDGSSLPTGPPQQREPIAVAQQPVASDSKETVDAALAKLSRAPFLAAKDLRNFTLPRTGRSDVQSVLVDAAISAAEWNVRLAAIVPEAVTALFDSSLLSLRPDVQAVQAALQAPSTPLNVTISAERTLALVSLSLDRVKVVAKKAGGKVNDVVLALVSGMLRSFLGDRGELPTKTLTGYVPISLRQSGDERLKNQTFGMTVPLSTDVADPRERLRRIVQQAGVAKELANPFKGLIPQLMDAPSFGTPMILQLWTAYAGRAGLADTATPQFNIVVSNVMLSNRRFFIAGAPIQHVFPLSIVTHGQALNVTVQGYGDVLDFGILAAASVVGDADILKRHLLSAFDELELAFSQ